MNYFISHHLNQYILKIYFLIQSFQFHPFKALLQKLIGASMLIIENWKTNKEKKNELLYCTTLKPVHFENLFFNTILPISSIQSITTKINRCFNSYYKDLENK